MAHVPDASASARTDYSYSSDNLLHEVTDVVSGVGTTTTMTWNADQQRLRLQSGMRDWRFIYDPTASIPAILFTSENTYGDETFYVREPGGELLSSYNGETMNYHYDAIGSVVLVSDNAGSVVDDSAYGAWGNTAESLNSFAPYRFVGQLGYYSHEAGFVGAGLGGLMQLGVRFYDAGIGGFTQRDSVRTPLQSYVYAVDNPSSFVDPSGRWAICNAYLVLIARATAAGNVAAAGYYTTAMAVCNASGSSAWESCVRQQLVVYVAFSYPNWIRAECDGHVDAFGYCDATVGGRPFIYRCLSIGIKKLCDVLGRPIPYP